MRLVFDSEYGDGELEYPLHGGDSVDVFESLNLNTGHNPLDDEEWARFQNEINVVNLADFYLLMWVAGDYDSTPESTLDVSNNWSAVRDRTGADIGGKWHFVDKDSESSLCTDFASARSDWNPTPPWNLEASLVDGVPEEYFLTPAWLMEAALTRAEFVQIF
jgi:hypothetical protein